jgi:osmoprotectant transport system permease protein
MNRTLYLALIAPLLLISCGGSKPIIVGSKAGPEQTLLGEIVAQHLETRLAAKVQRRLGFGDTQILYQAMINGDVTLYPDTTGVLLSEALKEAPSTTPSIALERARGELARVALLEVMPPLGFDDRTAMVVRAADTEGINTLTEAGQYGRGWKIGVSYDFQSRAEGLPALNEYRLRMAAAFQSMDAGQLFPALEQGTVTMIAAQAGDGQLLSPDSKILEDDRHVFSPQQAVLVVRQDAFGVEPRLKAALAELSGKLNLDMFRRLNAKVLIDERTPADVAREFLASAGL